MSENSDGGGPSDRPPTSIEEEATWTRLRRLTPARIAGVRDIVKINVFLTDAAAPPRRLTAWTRTQPT